MLPQLAAPGARFTFVVGKGGTGKSTAAAGLALAWAAAGHRVHLLSTDPAHSLGDVFATRLAGDASRELCVPGLTVEELDTAARADAWLARVRAPLTDLLERGSYLDSATIERFTSLQLPGSDEIMAALRLAELAAGELPCFVVDTAPTGHTLRLLDAHAVLAGWKEVLDALAAKADAVASALLGQAVRTAAGELRGELAEQLRSFDARVLRAAEFIVVTRAGEPVRAETARLRAALAARALPVRTVLHVGAEDGGTPEAGRVPVPWQSPAPRGCDGLARWAEVLGGAAAPEAPDALPGTPGTGAAWLRRAAPRLLLVAGKGGVGKSTCAAAAALVLAESRPVLLLSADPAGSLADVLGAEVGAEPAAIVPGLRAVQIDAARTVARWRAELRESAEPLLERLGLGGEPALDRRVMAALWQLTPPGMDELVALVELVEASGAGETVVLDSAPTGHFLRLLALPDIAQQWTRTAMRVLLEYGVAGQLDGLTENVIAFSKQLKDLRTRLADAGWTGAIIVTMAEPVVEAESTRLVTALAAAGISVRAILTNRHAGSAAPAPLPESAVALRAPVCTPQPRGVSGLRNFAAQWELT